MTPDEARRLLDGTTPGPWEWADGKDDNVEYEALRGHGGVNALRTEDAELYASWICGTNADKALAAAAPTLASTLAGMRAEYAVQNRVGDKWLYEDADGRNLAPYDSHRISWWPDPIPQSDIADRGEGMARIVRRYVTEPEEA